MFTRKEIQEQRKAADEKVKAAALECRKANTAWQAALAEIHAVQDGCPHPGLSPDKPVCPDCGYDAGPD